MTRRYFHYNAVVVEPGVAWAVMEVSSHGILLDRVRGLELALGVFTNLVADEHLEFHPTPEHYVETKLRFLGLLTSRWPDVLAENNALDAAERDILLKERQFEDVLVREGVSPHYVSLQLDADANRGPCSVPTQSACRNGPPGAGAVRW